MNSADIFRHFAERARQAGVEARRQGDADAALAGAAARTEATYEVPYLAHATMEPMNCTVRLQNGRCEVWAPTQNPQGTQSTAARLTGLPIDAVTMHPTYLGCGWGRRSLQDFVQDAVETAMKTNAPVQLVWTREEDMQHDTYRPAAHVQFQGGVDAAGRAVALRARVVAPPFGGGRGNGADGNSVDGIANHQYSIANMLIDYVRPDVAVPVGYWRSVGPSQNTFMLESFIDEMAHVAKRDPFEFRRELLAGNPRLRHVLELAAEKAGWGTPLPAGRARGIALVEDKGGLVAQVAEVSVASGQVRVHRITCAADCGRVVHPGIAESQMVGSVVGALSALFYGEITIERGRVKQSNFHDYPLLRMAEMPDVDVHLVPSAEEPGGVGEPGLPPTAPAVTNAVFALTGTRIRRLPLRADALASAGGNGSR
jgi:CO/xanthine dehydrogenase Mo-binding subunit